MPLKPRITGLSAGLIVFFLILLLAVQGGFAASDSNETRIIFDRCESLNEWYTGKCDNEAVKINLITDKGVKGKCLRLDYDLDSPENYAWVQIFRSFQIQQPEGKEFRFLIKSAGAKNKVEFKVEDQDGSIFWRIFSPPDVWTEYAFKVQDLSYAWGGQDSKLDSISKIYFAISTIQNGSGSVFIDEVQANDVSKKTELTLSVSQVGYHPDDRKFAVLRISNPPDKFSGRLLYEPGNFTVTEKATGQQVYRGELRAVESPIWQQKFYHADFSEFDKPGSYVLKVHLPKLLSPEPLVSFPFLIEEHVFAKETAELEFSFLRTLHCGQNCHLHDPVIGGYHDTMFDLGKRMWSLPHLIFGISKFVQYSPVQFDNDKNGLPDSVDELKYAIDFALKMQLPSGGVASGGIHKEGNDVLPPTLKPEDDHSKRIMEQTPDVPSTGYYVVALVEASGALKKYDDKLSKQCIESGLRAYQWLNRQPCANTTDLGAKLWASTSLYRQTGKQKYLTNAKELVEELLPRQFLEPGRSRFGICGNFFNEPGKDSFLFQPKAHERILSVYMGLIDLEEMLDKADPLWSEIHFANITFAENYLLKMASLSPYCQIAELLVKSEKGTFEPRFFVTQDAWTQVHGMNCDHFAYGLVAIRLAHLYNDPRLEEFADNQVQWVLGNNPLNYCMISGAGTRNPQTFSGFYGKGPVPGGIPNGIVGKGGEGIEPDWIAYSWNSGEYWLPHNSYYLALIPYLDKDQKAE